MSEILKQAIEKLNAAPPALQEELARVVMDYPVDDSEIYQLTPEEQAVCDQADADIAVGNFATDKEMSALFDEFKQ
ncbi:hypothetical protein ACFQE0_27490 [Methylobacterium komagatae]|uniref:Addiction module component n=1 Tax=Methylobacterium komagatae TaxID=374425 RepID=A0ABW2BR89_9HYPH